MDVGCVNGYSNVRLALERSISIRGVDYIRDMIEQARERLSDFKGRLSGSIEFDVGDITSLDEPDSAYDKVVVTLVLINLGSWEDQIKGTLECARVLKPGGMLLLSEATEQGWRSMNRFRTEWGLPEIPMPPFNRYLDQDQLIREVSDRLELADLVNFSSTCYMGTRELKPLLIKALGADIDVGNPDMEWNRLFAELPSWGDYGTQKLFIFRKKF
jgi:SAM-dependent methyltransferase